MPKKAKAKTKSAPNKKTKLYAGLFSLLIVFAAYLFIKNDNSLQRQCVSKKFNPSQNCEYKLETANTDKTRAKGLSGRQSLARNNGMLFIFDQPNKNCIWMKEMKFDLDIIWLNHQKEIVAVEQQVSPDTYPKTFCPKTSTKYVIELNGGEIKRNNYKLADQLNF